MDLEPSLEPLRAIDEWREQARGAGARIPEAATLATLGTDGHPRARVVLVRARVERSYHFFTNYESDKALELGQHPHAALCIHHVELGVQARIVGTVTKLEAAASDSYFATRPRLSQLGAWASDQSRPLGSRAELEERLRQVTARFDGQDVPRPPNWGGYGLLAHEIELWADRAGRLHDRIRFTWHGAGFRAELLWP
jgi:pyridoxamine 5'-phosphate oxidase